MSDVMTVQIDGKDVFFEVDTQGDYHSEKVGVRDVASQVAGSFSTALETIRLVAGATVKEIRNIDGSSSPDEFQLQFGIKLSGEYGALVAKASGEAQISVTLTYKASDNT